MTTTAPLDEPRCSHDRRRPDRAAPPRRPAAGAVVRHRRHGADLPVGPACHGRLRLDRRQRLRRPARPARRPARCPARRRRRPAVHAQPPPVAGAVRRSRGRRCPGRAARAARRHRGREPAVAGPRSGPRWWPRAAAGRVRPGVAVPAARHGRAARRGDGWARPGPGPPPTDRAASAPSGRGCSAAAAARWRAGRHPRRAAAAGRLSQRLARRRPGRRRRRQRELHPLPAASTGPRRRSPGGAGRAARRHRAARLPVPDRHVRAGRSADAAAAATADPRPGAVHRAERATGDLAARDPGRLPRPGLADPAVRLRAAGAADRRRPGARLVTAGQPRTADSVQDLHRDLHPRRQQRQGAAGAGQPGRRDRRSRPSTTTRARRQFGSRGPARAAARRTASWRRCRRRAPS